MVSVVKSLHYLKKKMDKVRSRKEIAERYNVLVLFTSDVLLSTFN